MFIFFVSDYTTIYVRVCVCKIKVTLAMRPYVDVTQRSCSIPKYNPKDQFIISVSDNARQYT